MKKKKLLLIFVVLTIVILLGYFATQIFTKAREQDQFKNNRMYFPLFIVKDLNENEKNVKTLKDKEFILLIIFNPNCHYCQLEAEEIQIKKDQLQNFAIYFVSDAPKTEIDEFANSYHLNSVNNIVFLHDKKDKLSDYVGATGVPFMLLYNSNRKLIKTYKGSIKLDAIIKDAEKY